MFRPLLLGGFLLLTPALLAQASHSNPDQPGDAFTESAGVIPAPPLYATFPSTPLRAELGTQGPFTSPRVLRVSGGVMAGLQLTRTFPVYPHNPVSKGCGKMTVLSVLIGIDGRVRDLQLISGPQECTAPIIQAVRQWTYKPYLLNGKPVEVSTTVTMTAQFTSQAAKTSN